MKNSCNKVVFDRAILHKTHKQLAGEQSREIVKALGHNVSHSTTASVVDAIDYTQTSRSTDQVSYSRADQINANTTLSHNNAQHGGTLHTHIEKQGHAWQWSSQDYATIQSMQYDPLNQYHVLTYICKNGSTLYRAVDNTGKDIPFVTTDMNISHDLMGVMVTSQGDIQQISLQ